MAGVATVALPALRYWRAWRGFTQEQLADRIGMRRNTIWLIESGHRTRIRTAKLLAKALGVSVAQLQRQRLGPRR
jgi:transcriptional regulator with XRE-family HTH domain